jgi:hypothetical protein
LMVLPRTNFGCAAITSVYSVPDQLLFQWPERVMRRMPCRLVHQRPVGRARVQPYVGGHHLPPEVGISVTYASAPHPQSALLARRALPVATALVRVCGLLRRGKQALTRVSPQRACPTHSAWLAHRRAWHVRRAAPALKAQPRALVSPATPARVLASP